jgi:nitrite reductase/ring-hydroxylating ferredoxin subunit
MPDLTAFPASPAASRAVEFSGSVRSPESPEAPESRSPQSPESPGPSKRPATATTASSVSSVPPEGSSASLASTDSSANKALKASRRSVLKGAALAGAGLGLAACSPTGTPRSAVPTTPEALGTASAVPVGGAKLYREQRVVVSCPAQGQYKAFSAVCTHEGCVLTEVHGTVGECPCHGSRFDVMTGQVLQGPASKPLPEVPVRTEGADLVAGPEAAKGTGAAGRPGSAQRSAGT